MRTNPNKNAPTLHELTPLLPIQPGEILFIPVIGAAEVRKASVPAIASAKALIGQELDTVNLWDDHVMLVDDFGAPADISLVRDRAKALPVNPLATRLYQEVRGTTNKIYGPAVVVRDSDFA